MKRLRRVVWRKVVFSVWEREKIATRTPKFSCELQNDQRHDDLNRFAEPHFVCDDSSYKLPVQLQHPLHALLLIGVENLPKMRRNRVARREKQRWFRQIERLELLLELGGRKRGGE